MSVLTTDLTDHLALVTGASGGIGKATCLALASMGCSIAAHYNSNADKAAALVEELKAKGVKAQAFQADVNNYDEVRRLHASVTANLGAPTILFNNAGLSLGKTVHSISDISIEEFETTWRANCGSAFLLTQLCMPAMETAGWGRVIFCSSVAGFNGGVIGPHYASSKSALHGLVHWLANIHSKSGITINGSLTPQRTTEIPLGRLGYPEEIAETVIWMVKTGYVTNKVVGVDGGFFVQ
ncbi:uncharacterized protein K452DRAFT_232935 [Aplosporella prunicola CBS 121167]|uniref:3-oxoacyl-[acyl-carrier-protein] reductase n=1 Tax=Aplosporella prunicola CBS 121167 TaxID=1176127 RepID=A0A6A6B866_9PEZI|nr:uncharacterized protein K452DRAFT_232935 [Aplosporella prunicola CBS 121167]KAF2139097.1 hypothetical protein K452DRAFT_232935 [Aplosporella prunicola CBS 121167]